VRLRYPYLDEDEVVFELPPGFRVEAAPEPVEIEAAFGYFRSASEVHADGKLRFTRKLKMTEVLIPAEQYEDYRHFRAAVVQADRAQVVLVTE
jgi:hypothetical protein